ncbi:hypothetical protein WMF45_02675 [Sorangium sp. So ce448]|uniref:hypothetical protein n=1 Tax=Sorangium sp. So ce448 TaxID=3133314 RepID=UPI003F62824A
MTHSLDLSNVDALYTSGYFGPPALAEPEFYWISLMGSLLGYRDGEGRPLGEEMAPSEVQRGVPMEMRECPYAGSRQKHRNQMNVSSLRQFSAYWPAVVGGLAVLREEYLRHAKREGDGRITLIDLWKFSRTGIALPAWLLRRAHAPLADGGIPPVSSIIYRMMLGVNRVAHLQLLMISATGVESPEWAQQPAALYDYTDGNDLFIGLNSVCAGSRPMIEETFRVLLGGDPGPSADRAPMRALVDRPFLVYAGLLHLLEVQKYIFGARAASALQDLVWKTTRPGGAAPSLLGAALKAFQERIAGQVSSLAQEVAFAGEAIRDVMLARIEGFRAELHDDYRATSGDEGLLDEIVRVERAAAGEPGAGRVLELLGGVDAPDADTVAFVSALVDYLRLERGHIAAFELLQRRLDRALGRPSPPLVLGGDDITKAFGPKLRDFAAEHFGLRIVNSATSTTFHQGGRELRL